MRLAIILAGLLVFASCVVGSKHSAKQRSVINWSITEDCRMILEDYVKIKFAQKYKFAGAKKREDGEVFAEFLEENVKDRRGVSIVIDSGCVVKESIPFN